MNPKPGSQLFPLVERGEGGTDRIMRLSLSSQQGDYNGCRYVAKEKDGNKAAAEVTA